VALITVGLLATNLYANAADSFLMTSRATGANGPTFDATQWFRSGMYVAQEFDGKLNPFIMMRSKPFVFTAKDNEFLIQAAIEALEDVQPEVDTKPIWDAWPVLTRRVRYTYSVFSAPNKPADLYNLYLQVSYRKFVIGLQLDGDAGNLVYDGDVVEVDTGNEEHEAYVKVFEEMDDAGTR
jgi:hypothetical protein